MQATINELVDVCRVINNEVFPGIQRDPTRLESGESGLVEGDQEVWERLTLALAAYDAEVYQEHLDNVRTEKGIERCQS